MFILPEGRQAVLLQFANMYVIIGLSNTTRNTVVLPWQFDKRMHFAKVYHLMCRNIAKMADKSLPVNPRMPCKVPIVTSSGCLKLHLNL